METQTYVIEVTTVSRGVVSIEAESEAAALAHVRCLTETEDESSYGYPPLTSVMKKSGLRVIPLSEAPDPWMDLETPAVAAARSAGWLTVRTRIEQDADGNMIQKAIPE